MTSSNDLTPKQRQVYELLEKGLSPNTIAERLKVTPQAISLHMRNMREKGISLPNGQMPVSTAPAATGDGSEDLDAMVRSALERRLEQIDIQRVDLDQQAEKYRLALEALT